MQSIKRAPVRWVVVCPVLMVGSMGAWGQPTSRPATMLKVSEAKPPGKSAAPSEEARKRYADLHKLYEEANKGVVKVLCEGEGTLSTGTGFFVSPGGLIATNWHVICDQRVRDVKVEMGELPAMKAHVIAVHKDADVAILLPTVPVTPAYVFRGRPAPDVKVGESAISVGHPSGLRSSLAKGIVSGVRTPAEVCAALRWPAGFLQHAYAYIQTDAAIDHGNSGGPLMDEKGNVLGVCTLRKPESRFGFAIGWEAVADLLKTADKSKPIGLVPFPVRGFRECNCLGYMRLHLAKE